MKNRNTILLVLFAVLSFVNFARGQVAGAVYSLSPAVFVRDGWSLYFVLEPTASGERVACVAGIANIDRTLGDNLAGVCYYPSYDSAGNVVDWTTKSWSAASHKDVIKSLNSQFPLQDTNQWSLMTGIVGIGSGRVKTQSKLVDGLLEGDTLSTLMSNSQVRETVLPVLVQNGYPASDLFVEKDVSVSNAQRAKLLTSLSGEAVAAAKFVKTGKKDNYSDEYLDQSTLQAIATFDLNNGGVDNIRKTKWTLNLPNGSAIAAFGFDVFARPALMAMENGVVIAQAQPGIVVPVWRSLPGPTQIFGLHASCVSCAASEPQGIPNRKIWFDLTPQEFWTGLLWPWYIKYTAACILVNGQLYVLIPYIDSKNIVRFAWFSCN
jgi:hypothetical protein